jgi:hypothetical protein
MTRPYYLAAGCDVMQRDADAGSRTVNPASASLSSVYGQSIFQHSAVVSCSNPFCTETFRLSLAMILTGLETILNLHSTTRSAASRQCEESGCNSLLL